MDESLRILAEGFGPDDAEGEFKLVDMIGDVLVLRQCGKADGAVKESGPRAVIFRLLRLCDVGGGVEVLADAVEGAGAVVDIERGYFLGDFFDEFRHFGARVVPCGARATGVIAVTAAAEIVVFMRQADEILLFRIVGAGGCCDGCQQEKVKKGFIQHAISIRFSI